MIDRRAVTNSTDLLTTGLPRPMASRTWLTPPPASLFVVS